MKSLILATALLASCGYRIPNAPAYELYGIWERSFPGGSEVLTINTEIRYGVGTFDWVISYDDWGADDFEGFYEMGSSSITFTVRMHNDNLLEVEDVITAQFSTTSDILVLGGHVYTRQESL